MLDRRTFLRAAGATGLAVVAGPAALGACSSGDAPDEVGQLGLVQFGAGVGPESAQIGAWFTIAQRLGYFAQEGVRARVMKIQTPSALVQAGKLQSAIEVPSELLPFVVQNPSTDIVVAWTAVPTPIMRAAVPATSDIHQFSDMAGKRIGTLGPGLNWSFVDALSVQAGIDPKSVQKLTVPFTPAAMVASFRQNRMDAGLFADTLVVQTDELLEGDPMGPLRVLPIPESMKTKGNSHYIFRRSTVDRNHDFYVGYLRGVAKGWTFLNANLRAGLSVHLDAYPLLRRSDETREDTIDRLVREVTPRLAASQPPAWATEKHPWGWTYEENLSGWEDILPVLRGRKLDTSRLFRNDLVGLAYDFDSAAIVKAAKEYKIS